MPNTVRKEYVCVCVYVSLCISGSWLWNLRKAGIAEYEFDLVYYWNELLSIRNMTTWSNKRSQKMFCIWIVFFCCETVNIWALLSLMTLMQDLSYVLFNYFDNTGWVEKWAAAVMFVSAGFKGIFSPRNSSIRRCIKWCSQSSSQ